MSRLVDIDEVVKAVDRHTKDEPEVILDDDITCILEEVPTAYDVEKVVAELEEHKTQYGKLQFAHNDANMVCVYVGKEQAIDCAIDIVRKGGIDG